jgi:GDPmannose 4,6-dehydratase
MVVIIAGVSGQDGSYMAERLISNGLKVFGLTRKIEKNKTLPNIEHLGSSLNLIETDYGQDSIDELIKEIQPSEIYNFTGQSYVSKSWDLVEDTIFSQGVIASRFLVAIEKWDVGIKFLNASSSEIFKMTGNKPITENSFISPYNPYGCAQSLGHLMVDAYRKNKGIYAVNAVLFPHESPRRNQDFAFQKIISTAVKIKNGDANQLKVGNLHVRRDWGYAPFFIDAMINMMSLEVPENFCLCTGVSHSIEEVIEIVFNHLELDWKKYVTVEDSLVRNYEPDVVFGEPSKAINYLNIDTTKKMDDIIINIVEFEIKNYNNKRQYEQEIFL